MLRGAGAARGNPFLTGIWHYARGLAFVGKGQPARRGARTRGGPTHAARPGARLAAVLAEHGGAVLAIAPEVLAGELAAARKDYDTAIAHLERAVRLEDGLVYTEPAEWHYPPRHALGAVLLEAGRPDEAETVVLGGPEAEPGERLGALRPRAGARRAGQEATTRPPSSGSGSTRPGRAPTPAPTDRACRLDGCSAGSQGAADVETARPFDR